MRRGRHIAHSFEECFKDAQRFLTRGEWNTKSHKFYLEAWRNGWLEECCKHMKKPKNFNHHWTRDKVLHEGRKYPSPWSFSQHCYDAYLVANKKGWLRSYIKF